MVLANSWASLAPRGNQQAFAYKTHRIQNGVASRLARRVAASEQAVAMNQSARGPRTKIGTFAQSARIHTVVNFSFPKIGFPANFARLSRTFQLRVWT